MHSYRYNARGQDQGQDDNGQSIQVMHHMIHGVPHGVWEVEGDFVDNLSKLLTALSSIAAPSTGTLTKNVHKF